MSLWCSPPPTALPFTDLGALAIPFEATAAIGNIHYLAAGDGKRNHAQAAFHFCEERSRQDLRNLINIVRKWAERREDRALDWLTALWDVACKSRRWNQRENRRVNTGSIVFYTFPQHLVDMIVERTGGRPNYRRTSQFG